MEDISRKLEDYTLDELEKLNSSIMEFIRKQKVEKLKDIKQDKIGKIFKDDMFEQYYLITEIDRDKYCTVEIEIDDDRISMDGIFLRKAEEINDLKEISFDYVLDPIHKKFKEIENKFKKHYEVANKYKEARNEN